jgi:hypothetical protein
VSDLCAGLVGGLGVAASLCGPHVAPHWRSSHGRPNQSGSERSPVRGTGPHTGPWRERWHDGVRGDDLPAPQSLIPNHSSPMLYSRSDA